MQPRHEPSLFARHRVIGIAVAMIVSMAASMVLPAAIPAATAATPQVGSRLPSLTRPLNGGSSAAASHSNLAEPHTGGAWSQANEIKGSTGGGLGSAVAVSGSTMVVGAPYDNSGIGAAYVYTGSGTSWTQEATLTPSDGVSGDDFGYSVAVSGGDIVVGSPCHSISANSCTGAAYVFTGSASSWTQAAEMNDPGQATEDTFGLPVAIASQSILVGALGENSFAGSVFVYTLQGAMKATITDPANTANDLFGSSIATAGKRMVVGAPGTTGSKGAVYYFNEVRGGWVKKATLTASNGEGCSATCSQPVGFIYGDYFGNSVALLKGTTIAVGAPYASYPTPEPDSVGSGAAYVFTGSGSSWSQTSEISDPTEDAANAASSAGCNGFSNPCNALDQFGYQVALVGTTVVAAAPYDSQGYPNNATGSAFLFQKSGSSWPTSSPIKLVSSDGVAGDEFGTSGLVTISKHAFAIASPYASGGAYNGSVYFFGN
jgi:hypothetical protein